jgi:flagellar hook-associated protein 3 FlgL
MRATFNAVRDGLVAINTAAEQFAEAQWQVSSGKRVRVPSDDPLSAQRAVQDQADITQLDAYTQASDSASSRLSAMDSTLGDVVNQLTQALTAAQSARGSAVNQTTRDAAALTLQGVRDAIAGDINTSSNGTYLFGGSKVTTQPYVPGVGAWTYQGDSTPVSVTVREGRSVTVAMNGQAILQGTDATDVLTALDSLATAVKSGDSAGMASGIDAVNRAFGRATAAQAEVGVGEASISDGTTQLAALGTAATTRLSADQDANAAEAITKMNQAQLAYQSALGAVAAAGKTSLLDYIQ